MTEKTARKMEKIKHEIGQGKTISEACKSVGMHPNYFSHLKRTAAGATKVKRRYRKTVNYGRQLKVTEIESLPMPAPQTFLVVGSPQALAVFAKGLL